MRGSARMAVLAAFCTLTLWISPSSGSTITRYFAFFDGQSFPVADGSFSYDSSVTGNLGFSNLSAFSITVAGVPYDLSFVNGLSSSSGDFVYFDYNPVLNKFVTGSVTGTYFDGAAYTTGTFDSILAATGTAAQSLPLTQGFFFDPISGAGADGIYSEYTMGFSGQAESLVIASNPITSAVPEASTWLMMLVGMVSLAGASLLRKKSRLAVI